MLTVELYKLKQENNLNGFYQRISTFIPDLEKFANTKLQIAENLGFIDKGFYNANDVLDEVYLAVFKTISKNMDEKDLRKILFIKTAENINKITKTASQFADHINVDDILKEELELLNEDYTVDAGGDFVLIKDLEDISYRQNDFKPTHFILDDTTEQLINKKLDFISTLSANVEKRSRFGKIFFGLPPYSKIIIEMHVFGNQSITEISEILLIKPKTVKNIIQKVTKIFEFIN